MAAVTHGMDVEAVKTLGHQMQTAAGNIDQLVNQINTLLHNTAWLGNDANQFKNDWWPKHMQALKAASHDLQGVGQSALNNASDQETASGH